MTCNHDIAYLVRNACNANARVQSGDAPGHARAPPVQPIRVYFGTQQIHARRETRARFDPNTLEAKHVNAPVKSRYTCLCRPHPKGHFHRTRNKCKREYVLPEAGSDDIEIRKIQFEFLKSGNTKVVPRKTVHRHDHVDHQQRPGRCLA